MLHATLPCLAVHQAPCFAPYSLLHTLWPPPVCVVERVGATSCAAARAFARGDEGVCRSRYLRRHVDRSNSRRRRWTELLQHTAGTCPTSPRPHCCTQTRVYAHGCRRKRMTSRCAMRDSELASCTTAANWRASCPHRTRIQHSNALI